MMRIAGLVLALAMALGPGARSGAGQTLTLLDRFGPDGLPFTHDDPLAAGGGASEYRYTAMALDACSEEDQVGFNSAHGFGGQHAPKADTFILDALAAHPRSNPADFLASPVLAKPFDFSAWIGAVNLGNAGVRRWRLYPRDAAPFSAEERSAPDRGWGRDDWKSSDPKFGQLWAAGTPAKNLHLEAIGLGHRDVKRARDPVGMGIPVGVKHETLKLFPQFPDALEGGRIDMFGQQDYFEAWVLELMNLDNGEAAISGNFVADLAGLQIGTTLKDVRVTQAGCTAIFDYVYIEVGGPAGLYSPEESQLMPSVFMSRGGRTDTIVNLLMNEMRFENPLCAVGAALAEVFGGVSGKIKEKVEKSFEKLDTIAALVIADGEDLMDVVRDYSGLADKTRKNPFDRVSMGALVKLGQFKPDRWMAWKIAGDVPSAMSFKLEALGIDPQTITEVIQGGAALGWRYNNGSSFLGKSGRIFGNSQGVDDTAGPSAISDGARDKVPDVLESYAKRWVYIEMDVLDPHELPEADRKATWKGVELLFTHDGPRPSVTVDWPPPNFGSGAAQIVSFRTGSGGVPRGSVPPDVDPKSALQSAFQVCIDPVTKTYSVSGIIFAEGQAPVKMPPRAGSTADYGWSVPRPLPDNLDPADNDSGLRWLSAAVGHHFEGMSTVQWMWDFQNDGQVDTEHAQHMSDVGSAGTFGANQFGTIFAFQPSAVGGAAKGRTGFALVPMNDAARQALRQ